MSEDDSQDDKVRKPTKVEVLGPAERQSLPVRPEDSLPPAEGLLKTSWWQSIRFRSFRMAIENYERAVRAAAELRQAHADLHDSEIELERSIRRLENLPQILEEDSKARKREWDLDKLRVDDEAAKLRLSIAQSERRIAEIQKGKEEQRDRAGQEKDLKAELREMVEKEQGVWDAVQALVEEEMEKAGVENEDDLPPESKRLIDNVRDHAKQSLSQGWHKPKE